MPFSAAEEFDFNTAVLVEDTRKNYGETRLLAYGLIGTRVHVVCFKPVKDGASIIGARIISLQKANKREIKRYVEDTSAFD